MLNSCVSANTLKNTKLKTASHLAFSDSDFCSYTKVSVVLNKSTSDINAYLQKACPSLKEERKKKKNPIV